MILSQQFTLPTPNSQIFTGFPPPCKYKFEQYDQKRPRCALQHRKEGCPGLKGEIPLVMIPLEVTQQNLATQEVFEHFKRFEHIPFVEAIHNMLQQFQIMYLTHQGFPFPPIHDPCTIFYILHPEEFEASYAHILVDTYPVSYGRTNVIFSRTRNNIVTTHLKNEKTKFWEEMGKIFENIFSEGGNSGF